MQQNQHRRDDRIRQHLYMIALGIAVARAGRGEGLTSLDIMLDLPSHD